MTTEIQTTAGEARDLAKMVESLVMRGDISALSPEHRVRYYVQTCEGLGLNPHSQPFAFLRLNGKEVMYATRGATDQLAAMHRINREIIDGPKIVDIAGQKVAYCVAKGTHPNGRTETATATLPVSDPVNLYMKLETKAKRRVTLSILGLGVLDETELETIPASAKGSAAQVDVSIVRDDAPAQPAPMDALAALRADLEAAESLDLEGARTVYARHDLGGTALSAVTGALCTALAARGYRLTATEAGQLLRGEMPDALAMAYDRLAAVDRHADDEDGDGVVADVVRVLRSPGVAAIGADAKRKVAGAKARVERLMTVSAQTVAGLLAPANERPDVDAAEARIRAALSPQPPTTPTGTDAPRSSATSADGGSVAPSQSAGAQASANDGPRYVADTDSAHVQVAGTWRESEAGWREHLAGMTVRRRVEASVGCNGALLGPRFLAMAAERIVELDAARPLPAGVARLTVLGVTQTLERVALDGSRARAAAAQAVAA
jgi:hypothetical protein